MVLSPGVGRASAAGVQPRGCKGRSPLHKITLSPPLPAGKGVGGMGAEKQSKGRVGRRQGRQAPRRAPQRQGRTAARKASPRHHPKQHGKSGTGCKLRRQTIKYREKFLGVWGLLSRSPQRFSASPLLCSPSPADYPFRLQSCMALFTSPETRHSIPRQATGKRSERRESSEGEKSERTQAARS